MTLRILSVKHDHHGLPEVQRVSQHTDSLSASLRRTAGVEGVLTLATCNRVEFVVDAPEVPESHLRLRLARELDTPPDWMVHEGDAALEHLFRVASGLASMVVGEREIAGQLRRALQEATTNGHASGTLITVVNAALRTSRRVGAETALHASGRSVVSVGLDMTGIADWASQHVLLIGTGSYAGAVIASLKRRGVSDIMVNSASGRAAAFAERHQVRPAPSLAEALSEATLVVTCRGSATPVVGPQDLADSTASVLLDLSLQPDIDPAVANLPGVRLLDLGAIQSAISPTWAADSTHADRLVAEGVSDLSHRLASRAADPAVASLRTSMLQLVDDEVARLPQGRALTVEDCALALRRLTTRLLHIPSTRARDAAAEGRIGSYLAAIEELYGIDTTGVGTPHEARCPVTGLSLADLDRDPTEVP